MKTRLGFVSNSSSSSFVIDKHHLSPAQIEQIENHIAESKGMKTEYDGEVWACEGDKWDIEVVENAVRGSTFMDNFDMRWFLKQIGVTYEAILWDY